MCLHGGLVWSIWFLIAGDPLVNESLPGSIKTCRAIGGREVDHGAGSGRRVEHWQVRPGGEIRRGLNLIGPRSPGDIQCGDFVGDVGQFNSGEWGRLIQKLHQVDFVRPIRRQGIIGIGEVGVGKEEPSGVAAEGEIYRVGHGRRVGEAIGNMGKLPGQMIGHPTRGDVA